MPEVSKRFHNLRYAGYERPLGVLSGAGYVYLDGPLAPYVGNRVLQQYAIMYLLEGGGIYSDPLNGQLDVRAGDAILLFPGLAHTYERSQVDMPWTEVFLELSGRLFSDLENAGEISRKEPILHPGLSSSLAAPIDELVRDYLSASPGEEAVYCARAYLILTRILEAHRKHQQQDAMDAFVERACVRLNSMLDAALDVGIVASGFGMSERNFRRRFTEQVGVAPARYRLLQRVAAAKTLLNNEKLPLVVISERLGYCDPRAFTKQFKAVTGTTPAQFRSTLAPDNA